jgi:hypothetical protein
MTYGIDNPGLGLGQAQKYGRVKPVNEILLIIGSPTTMQIQSNLSIKGTSK